MEINAVGWDEKLSLGVLRGLFKSLLKPTEAIEIEEFFQASYAHGLVVPFWMVTIVFDRWKYWFILYEKINNDMLFNSISLNFL